MLAAPYLLAMRQAALLCLIGLLAITWGVGGYVPPSTDAGAWRLRVSRLDLTVPVVIGSSNEALDQGAGLVEGSALPGDLGNVAIAGHRDTVFRPLEQIREGDEIVVESPTTRVFYRVREIRITTPKDLTPLAPELNNTLTLITCYPFRYTGNAPQRFIVRAVETLALRRNPTTP
jgi:sortase A